MKNTTGQEVLSLQKEGKNQNYDFENHFGWHGKRFLNSDKLLNLKNEI